MLKAQELRGEVTRLLAEIRQRHEAAQRGFAGLTHGTGSSVCIIQLFGDMHELRRQLCELVGDAAGAMIAEELEAERRQVVSDQSQTPAISSFAPSDLLDISYSPELLLEIHLDVSITGDADFSDACEWGFIAFLQDVENGYYDHFSESEVRTRVRREMLEVQNPQVDQGPLAWYVGFVLGWLSALAFVQRGEALAGLSELIVLVDRLE